VFSFSLHHFRDVECCAGCSPADFIRPFIIFLFVFSNFSTNHFAGFCHTKSNISAEETCFISCKIDFEFCLGVWSVGIRDNELLEVNSEAKTTRDQIISRPEKISILTRFLRYHPPCLLYSKRRQCYVDSPLYTVAGRRAFAFNHFAGKRKQFLVVGSGSSPHATW